MSNRIVASEAQFHPVVDIFPPMSDAELRELVEDIREYGLREPVWVDTEGRVIDGRNRVLACAELERSVECRTYHGTDDSIVDFVVSLNLKRRHLDTSQRAMVAARLANMKRGGDRKSEDFKGSIDPLISQAEAAKQLNVSKPSVKRAALVQEHGAPELVAAVDAGKVAVSTAADVATLPKEEQRALLESADTTAIKDAAKGVRERKRKKGLHKKKPFVRASNAERYANMAIRQLEGIRSDDPNAVKELDRVIDWINERKQEL